MATLKTYAGNSASDRDSSVAAGFTIISGDNYARASAPEAGINKVSIWAETNISGLIVAMFDGGIGGGNTTSIDSYTIGSVTAGSKQSFTGVDLACNQSSAIGAYFTGGSVSRTMTGGSGGMGWLSGNQIDGSAHSYTWDSAQILSLEGKSYGAPTVTTQAASSIGTTTATGNGNITNTGGYTTCEKRGVQWGLSTGSYTTNVEVTAGGYSTGAYTISLTGLPSDTTIYARAYATDADGLTGYGDEITFDTLVIYTDVGGLVAASLAANSTIYLTRNVMGTITAVLGGAGTNTGSVTLANMRLSAVDGTAFVDFGAAGALTPYGGCLIKITDSAGKQLIGYIKAAGTGETLGPELMTNGTFESGTTGWLAVEGCTVASVAGGYIGNCLELTRTGLTEQKTETKVSIVQGKAYRVTGYAKSGTAGNKSYVITAWYNSYMLLTTAVPTTGDWVGFSHNFVAAATVLCFFGLRKIGADEGTMLFDEISVKQLLTPSATGVTIVSTRGGSTQSWASQDAGFNYNDASGYTYEIMSYGFATANISRLRAVSGESDANLSADMLISKNVDMSGEADARLSTYATLGINGNQGLITGY